MRMPLSDAGPAPIVTFSLTLAWSARCCPDMTFCMRMQSGTVRVIGPM